MRRLELTDATHALLVELLEECQERRQEIGGSIDVEDVRQMVQTVITCESITGAWRCENHHMFEYEPPPAWPPFCAIAGCDSGKFVWIVKDEVTSRDWGLPV